MTETLIHSGQDPDQWWKDAVIYQIYPRSFASSGGKVGDLKGITQRLDHIAELGADAIWLSPFYLSPQKDGGYDVADYRLIDPRFGTNEDAFAMFERAHELGMKVIVDLVPNHTSDQHEWFQAALAGGPEAPERELYHFREGRGEDGTEPPTDWISIFGGSAWTRVKDREDAPGSAWENDGSWYLNLFDSSQPDLNWENPKVADEFDDILRFWLERGVDGFRVDVAHGLIKDMSFPNWQFHWDMVSGDSGMSGDIPPAPMWDLDGVHDVYRRWRGVLDEFGPDRMLVAEAWVATDESLAKYVRNDEMSQSFNFAFLISPFTAADLRETIASSLAAMDSVGAPTTWVLSNHDVVRAASRLGLSVTGKGPNGIREGDEQPDAELGKARALAAHMLQSALPGSCYIYQGEELSLPEHMALPDDVREDPAFFRTKGEEVGRDGQRVPMPWEADKPGFGFSPDGATWLPQPAEWAEIAVDVQRGDEDSSLAFFTKMYELRSKLGLGHSALYDVADGEDQLHYISRLEGREDVHLVVAFDEPVEISADANVLLASADLTDGKLPANSAVWYQTA